MSKRPSTPPSPARRVAFTLMLVILVGLAFSFPMTLGGDWQGALTACGITFVVALAVLILGTLIVANSRARGGDDQPE
ncbi:MAG TPA: hypothetical protein PKX07_15200 [Aggregatilineales bacterium]|jgi:hypothetical protein|nr:hypothetical protein [Aggregatilineales bacterium]